jgi:NADPH:quinone reductase-like Zn-dependent oxidoreductase
MSAAATLDQVSSPATVRRVVIHRAGGYDRLAFEEVAPTAPGVGEVAIDVRAVGVNYADVIVRMGLYASAKEFVGWPITPGFEVSGVITAIGPRDPSDPPDAPELKVGDAVIACTLFGGYTTHLVTKRRYVYHKPANLSFEQAAGAPAVLLTAWYAIHELAHPRPGQIALVHSAAGGVGSSLVQILKLGGNRVVGVVGSSHKVEAAKRLGCDVVIDKSTQDLWKLASEAAPNGFDSVYDANGVETLKESYRHLRKAGKLVIYGFSTMMPKSGGKPNWRKLVSGYLRTPRFNPLDLTKDSKSVMAFNLSYLFDRMDILGPAMNDITRWLADGSLQPPTVTTYKLADVAQAHRDIESGKTIGKLVLVP